MDDRACLKLPILEFRFGLKPGSIIQINHDLKGVAILIHHILLITPTFIWKGQPSPFINSPDL
jgi:hypothetical protein